MHAALLLPLALAGVAAGSGPTVEILDFTATWCGPCQRMKPLVRRLAAEGFPIREVEITERPDVARKYGVTAYPTFMLVVDGREVSRVTGMQSPDGLRRLLAAAPDVGSPHKPTRGDFVRPVIVAEASGRVPVRAASDTFGGAAPLAMPPGTKTPRANNRTRPAVVRAQGGEADAVATRPAADPVDSALRVRVNNARDKQGKRGINFGSATMIGRKEGRVVAVSCAHTFRGIDGESTVELDLFDRGEVATAKAHVVRVDPEADVAVIAFVPPAGVAVSTLAPLSSAVEQRDHVFSVGCDDGAEPTKRQHRVTRVNAYVGPDTIECTGTPKTGRSGGGLFDTDGRLVGICFAAELELKRGIYAGLAEVHDVLRQAGLGDLCPGDASAPRPAVSPGADEFADVLAAANALSSGGGGNDGFADFAAPAVPSKAAADTGFDAGGPLEVVCIIRRPGAAEGEGEVLVIHEASPMFLNYLRGERADDNPVAGSTPPAPSADARAGFELTEPTSGRLERYVRSASH